MFFQTIGGVDVETGGHFNQLADVQGFEFGKMHLDYCEGMDGRCGDAPKGVEEEQKGGKIGCA
ncbi:hypothetical protein AGMMS49545_06640 [Betaproteobacteria bacterium]|nr:hypothetical protein AGMMS49545_06640 [Betaproteobacteria bacterium]